MAIPPTSSQPTGPLPHLAAAVPDEALSPDERRDINRGENELQLSGLSDRETLFAVVGVPLLAIATGAEESILSALALPLESLMGPRVPDPRLRARETIGVLTTLFGMYCSIQLMRQGIDLQNLPPRLQRLAAVLGAILILLMYHWTLYHI